MIQLKESALRLREVALALMAKNDLTRACDDEACAVYKLSSGAGTSGLTR